MIAEQDKKCKCVDTSQFPIFIIRNGSINWYGITAITKLLYDRLVSIDKSMKVILIRKFMLRGAFHEKRSLINNKVKLSYSFQNKKYTQEFFIIEKLTLLFDIILETGFLIKYKM